EAPPHRHGRRRGERLEGAGDDVSRDGEVEDAEESPGIDQEPPAARDRVVGAVGASGLRPREPAVEEVDSAQPLLERRERAVLPRLGGAELLARGDRLLRGLLGAGADRRRGELLVEPGRDLVGAQPRADGARAGFPVGLLVAREQLAIEIERQAGGGPLPFRIGGRLFRPCSPRGDAGETERQEQRERRGTGTKGGHARDCSSAETPDETTAALERAAVSGDFSTGSPQLATLVFCRFKRLDVSERSTSSSASRSAMFLTCATSLTMKYFARSYIFFSRNDRLFRCDTRRRFLSTSATSVSLPVFILSRFCLYRPFQSL